MDRRTASRRAAVATAVGLALPLSLVAWSGISRLAADAREEVACSLLFITGDLVADNGRVALANSNVGNVALDWPDRWSVRPTYDGQLEVVDDMGTVRTRTGEAIKLEGVVDPRGGGYGAWIRDGELVVCPWGLLRYGLAPDSDAP
jgi:hypothetical protein